jgi:hypothetical protein
MVSSVRLRRRIKQRSSLEKAALVARTTFGIVRGHAARTRPA